MSEIQLNQVIVGIGNVVYDQHHRENRMDLNHDVLNRAVTERFNGGISASTINDLATTGGGLAAQAGGVVQVEGGWNQRRGLCLLRMTVVSNSLKQDQMAVLGYLTGGSDSVLGVVPDDVLFVPVRSWTVSTESTQGADYLPTTKTGITESSQFLMADSSMTRDLQSIRPVDVINYGFGELAAEEEESGIPFGGVTNSNLEKNGVVVSKAANLNPIANAQTIMNHAARVSRNQVSHNTLSENMALSMSNLRETEVFEHPFLAMMMSVLGMPNYAGFIGFTFAELRQAFFGFDNVMSPPSDRNVDAVNHTLKSNALGAVDYQEIMSHELAFISMHSMLDVGLMYAEFVASNNVSNMGINNGEIYWQPGASNGLIPNDPYLYNRMEQLKDYIQSSFFQKYAMRMMGNSTIVSVSVKMNIFGECSVDIVLNGNDNMEKTFVYPSYCINRTSSNIAAGDMQKALATNYVENLQNYFVSR